MKHMKAIVILILMGVVVSCESPKTEDQGTVSNELKEVLAINLKKSHFQNNWYVSLNASIEGLTNEQAHWKDSSDNHSICELVSHLTYWNEHLLMIFNGKEPAEFDGNNKGTFTIYCDQDWETSVRRIKELSEQWDEAVESGTADQIYDRRNALANMASHNAYHTGQIMYIRKMNGWWDNEKGVQ